MKTCVAYVSHTGNTKRLAEAISDTLKVPLCDILTAAPSAIADCDLLFLGTPVIGGQPAQEMSAFIGKLPHASGKKAILFCTYAIAKGGTFKTMRKALAEKGYETVLEVGKRGVKPSKTDFADILGEIAKTVQKMASG